MNIRTGMKTEEIRKRYLKFFRERGHTIIPSAPLVPENDPTTLFTGSGMQPLIPYLLGQAHPAGKRVADSQKSFRAEDIDEVGDNRHTTFFEMLGNWSFGDYFKQEQLSWFFEFLTDRDKGAGLDPHNLYVTVFAGDSDTGIPRDDESARIWQKLFDRKGIDSKCVELGSERSGSEKGMQGGRIFYYGVENNWWSRAGVPESMPPGEPGGPDSEVFYDFDPSGKMHDPKFGANCHPNCDCGRFMEMGNSVFMEYKKSETPGFEKLAQRNVDFGGGLERIATASNGDPDVFKIDVFDQLWRHLKKETGIKYSSETNVELKRTFRIVADHIRAAVFLMADGVEPSNKERGYVLRRLLRRTIFYMKRTHGPHLRETGWLESSIRAVVGSYEDTYPELKRDLEKIINLANKESDKFDSALKDGLKEFERLVKSNTLNDNAFNLYQNFGMPWELTWELATLRGLKPDKLEFQKRFEAHREKSRTASAGMFKGGLADHSERTTKLHTAHHLLLRALQVVLGPQVKQRGSNITSERLRMDFSYDRKLSEEEKKEVERIVNEKITEDLPVVRSEMLREEAEKLGAEHEFGQKYPERVSIYSIGPKSATKDKPQFESAFSVEFCGGPHVSHTGEIGSFEIVKEEAVSSGIRRIRAVIS